MSASGQKRTCRHHGHENQWPCMRDRNATSIGEPEAEPMTESTPHLGHMAVLPADSSRSGGVSSGQSTQSVFSSLLNTAMQWKQPHKALASTSRLWLEACTWAATISLWLDFICEGYTPLNGRRAHVQVKGKGEHST